MRHVVGLALASLLAGCDAEQNLVPPDWGLNRMIHQPRADIWEESSFFEDGKVMQAPPEGTVPVEARIGPEGLVLGTEGGAPVEGIPLVLTAELLARGRERFDIHCAVCHGTLGAGESVVARRMELVKPPSLHLPRIRLLTPGRVYQVIAEGYGMMPGYRHQLSVEDRWAVVAYLRALQLSQGVDLAGLPPEVRRRAEQELSP